MRLRDRQAGALFAEHPLAGWIDLQEVVFAGIGLAQVDRTVDQAQPLVQRQQLH